jgi:hypothetical protein
MTLKDKIMKLQTYKMFVGENTVYVERDDILKLLEQEPILNKLKEKDEAKAVRYEGDGYADGAMVYDMALCPNCEHVFEEDSENWECDFCPNCGQKLRWEE